MKQLLFIDRRGARKQISPMQTQIDPNLCPIGKVKCFGDFGPSYEVGSPLRETEDGDWMVLIKLVATGEETEYPLSKILDDPDAR